MQRVDLPRHPRSPSFGFGPRALSLLLLSTSLLAGCATVQSEQKATNDALDVTAAGLNYFLPKKMVKLTVTRETVDLDKLEKARDAAAAKLDAATKAKAEKAAEYERQKAVLDQLATDSSARPAQARATEIAKAQATLAQTALAKAQEELPRTASAYYSALNADKANACSYTAKLELQPAQADTRYRYVARLKHNWLRDDTLKLAVNPAGLLTSANVVAVDRTGDILVDIAGAVAGGGGSSDRRRPCSPTERADRS